MTILSYFVVVVLVAVAIAACSIGAWLVASVVLWVLAVRAVAEPKDGEEVER